MWGTVAQLKAEAEEHRRAWEAWHDIQRVLPERSECAANGLTICSVAYRARQCLELNDRLMRRLNPSVALPTWLLFDNNVEPEDAIPGTDPRFSVTRWPGGEFTRGYDHALGIGRLLGRVRTRFLLILDPDCFVVMPDWIERVHAHMLDHDLAFFGTPINPRRHNSYRYFPYMVCMFVDLARVAARDLCFVPDVWRWRTNAMYRLRLSVARMPKVGHAFRWLLTEQYRTNGWRIKAQFGRHPDVTHECVQPVWNIDEAIPRGSAKRLLHTLTPAVVSPVPKRADYCSPIGFAAMGAPDVAALGWEEFVWKGRPFAFHVGSVHGKPGRYEAELDAVVQKFLRAEELAA